MEYEKIFRMLAAEKVDYLIAGGLAVNLHGVPRFTRDIDLMVDPSEKNLARLGKALKKLGYRPKYPVRIADFLNPENWGKWKREKGMTAFNLYHPRSPLAEIDVLIDPPFAFEKAKARRTTLQAGNIRLFLLSLGDLIRAKKKAGREQDIADVEALSKVRRKK